MIRVDDDPYLFLPESVPVPVKLGDQAFMEFYKLPRFVAEPYVHGPRVLIVFGRFPRFFTIAGVEQYYNNYEFDSCELAGTVVDAVIGDPLDDGCAVYIMDIVVWKGMSLAELPLRERMKYIGKLLGAVPKDYRPMYWAYKFVMKNCLLNITDGQIILKDMAALYKSVRGWFIRKEIAW